MINLARKRALVTGGSRGIGAAITRALTENGADEVGSHVLTGDEAQIAGGGGLGPAPFELLAAALAECTAMTMRWYAIRQGWAVDEIAVAVDYTKKQLAGATVASDFFQKTITYRAPDLTDEQRARLLSVAIQCPVQRTLEASSTITTVVGAFTPASSA